MNSYDIVKLETLSGINVKSALMQFAGYQEYFAALDDFVNSSKHYLSDYEPFKIIYDDNVRQRFFAETQQIKEFFHKLNLTGIASELEMLDCKISNADMEGLITALIQFQEDVSTMAQYVLSARLPANAAAPHDSQNTQNLQNMQSTQNIPNMNNTHNMNNTQGMQNMEKPIIIAVDDKPELLMAIISALEEKFRVMAVTSGKKALKVIEKHIPELFLLDIEMPEMDGYKLAEEIRRRPKFSRKPIIFLSGINTRTSVIDAVKNGGNDYLLKPVDKALLLSKVLQHLGRV